MDETLKTSESQVNKTPTKNNGIYLLFGIIVIFLIIFGLAIYFLVERPNNQKIKNLENKIAELESEEPEDEESEMKEEFSQEITCLNPYQNEGGTEETYKFTGEVSTPSEIAKLAEESCGFTVKEEDYTLQILTVYEGTGYAYPTSEGLPEAVKISTPKLNVKYEDDYETKSVVRLTIPEEENKYTYSSDYRLDVEDCGGLNKVDDGNMGCATSVITLPDVFLEIYCEVTNITAIKNCDQIIESLSLEKVE